MTSSFNCVLFVGDSHFRPQPLGSNDPGAGLPRRGFYKNMESHFHMRGGALLGMYRNSSDSDPKLLRNVILSNYRRDSPRHWPVVIFVCAASNDVDNVAALSGIPECRHREEFIRAFRATSVLLQGLYPESRIVFLQLWPRADANFNRLREMINATMGEEAKKIEHAPGVHTTFFDFDGGDLSNAALLGGDGVHLTREYKMRLGNGLRGYCVDHLEAFVNEHEAKRAKSDFVSHIVRQRQSQMPRRNRFQPYNANGSIQSPLKRTMNHPPLTAAALAASMPHLRGDDRTPAEVSRQIADLLDPPPPPPLSPPPPPPSPPLIEEKTTSEAKSPESMPSPPEAPLPAEKTDSKVDHEFVARWAMADEPVDIEANEIAPVT